ncbi:MAG: hypothetical protein ACD_43C00270G0001, partial [uncultured bacterium]
MVRANWRNKLLKQLWLVALVGLIGYIVLPGSGLAKTKQTTVRLDAATIERGYTITLGKTALGIPPATFSEPVTVWLRRKKNSAALPAELNEVSKVTSYTIKQSNSGVLNQAVWLSYKFTPVDLTYERSFYYFDNTTATWEKIPSWLNQTTGVVTAAWAFPHSDIVVA